MEEGYNVVFERTEEKDTVKGIRTWTTYGTKENFDKSYVPDKSESVIAEGISQEEAV